MTNAMEVRQALDRAPGANDARPAPRQHRRRSEAALAVAGTPHAVVCTGDRLTVAAVGAVVIRIGGRGDEEYGDTSEDGRPHGCGRRGGRG